LINIALGKNKVFFTLKFGFALFYFYIFIGLGSGWGANRGGANDCVGS